MVPLFFFLSIPVFFDLLQDVVEINDRLEAPLH